MSWIELVEKGDYGEKGTMERKTWLSGTLHLQGLSSSGPGTPLCLSWICITSMVGHKCREDQFLSSLKYIQVV